MTRWLPGYKYRKKLTATASGTTATDYQVMWRVYYVAGTDATNQVFIPKCKTDLSDIRFTLDDGYSTLPFWIEHPAITGSGYNVWVKVPSVLTTGTAVYLYYGRDAVASASDGNKTFELFDDYEGSQFDAAKWDVSTGTSIANSVATVTDTGANGRYIKSVKTDFCKGYSFRSRLKSAHFNSTACFERWWLLWNGANGEILVCTAHGSGSTYEPKYWNWNGTSNGFQTITGMAADTYCVMEVRLGTDRTINTINDANLVENSTNYPANATGQIGISAYGNTASWSVDWVAVRKYATTEPACTVTGIEEVNSIRPIIQKGWRL